MACDAASSQIAFERNGCVGDSLDIALGIQIEVRTSNREPDVRDLGVPRRDVQSVRRLEAIRRTAGRPIAQLDLSINTNSFRLLGF